MNGSNELLGLIEENNKNLPVLDHCDLKNCTIVNYDIEVNTNLELEQQRLENLDLKNNLVRSEQSIQLLNHKLHNLEKLNHKLSLDLEYHLIQINNFKAINYKFELAIKALQANKDYIYQLLAKKCRASSRINRLIHSVKCLQNMVKQKNALITKFSFSNSKLLDQIARIIKESYSI